ncbi:hypothetical protein EDB19DRAFT_275696 [Suillus lakei]|nr:hypothetical protein EDB19DRAFT_275696 [Suillus lakei]
MQMDSNIRPSYFDSAPYPFPHQPAPRQQSGRSAAVNMTNSPYFARTHSHSSSSPSLGHFSPSIRFNSYYSLAQQSPLPQQQSPHPQPLPDYSPYPSDSSAASAESPLSSSSANESPLPEPPVDSMENDTSHVPHGHSPYRGMWPRTRRCISSLSRRRCPCPSPGSGSSAIQQLTVWFSSSRGSSHPSCGERCTLLPTEF